MKRCNPQNDMNCYYNKRWHDFYHDSENPNADNFSLLQDRIDDELFRFIIDNDDASTEISRRLLVFRESYYNAKTLSNTVRKLIAKIYQAKTMETNQAIRHLGRCMALTNRIGAGSFFSLDVQPHYRKPSVYVVHIYDSFLMEKESSETRKEILEDLDEIYDSMIVNKIPLPKKKKYLKRMIWFIEQLSRRSLTYKQLSDPSTSNSESMQNFLNDRSPFWKYYLEDYLQSPFVSYSNCRTIDYIDSFLKKDPERILPILIDSLIMSVFCTFSIDRPRSRTPSEFRRKFFLDLMIQYYGPYLEEVFQSRYACKEKEAYLKDMFQKMIDHTCQTIWQEDFFVQPTKYLAIEKLKNIKLIVGAQSFKYNLDAYPAMSSSDIQLNMMKINACMNSQRIAMIGKPKNQYYIGLGSNVFSFTVNAYYDPIHNTVYVPTAIYDDVFFDLRQSPEIHYGGIGTIIGHEIIHSFDNNGSRYDVDGTLVDWWTETDKIKYHHEVQKIVSQYANIRINGKQINSDLTLSENISDIIGLKISLRTFIKHYLPNANYKKLTIDEKEFVKRFIRQWVITMRDVSNDEIREKLKDNDPHAPQSLRVNLPFAHIDEYYQIYNPKPYDINYLKPADRLSIFD
jgi:predicted metalloendopeptidase